MKHLYNNTANLSPNLSLEKFLIDSPSAPKVLTMTTHMYAAVTSRHVWGWTSWCRKHVKFLNSADEMRDNIKRFVPYLFFCMYMLFTGNIIE
jgi:hypothetical protein